MALRELDVDLIPQLVKGSPFGKVNVSDAISVSHCNTTCRRRLGVCHSGQVNLICPGSACRLMGGTNSSDHRKFYCRYGYTLKCANTNSQGQIDCKPTESQSSTLSSCSHLITAFCLTLTATAISFSLVVAYGIRVIAPFCVQSQTSTLEKFAEQRQSPEQDSRQRYVDENIFHRAGAVRRSRSLPGLKQFSIQSDASVDEIDGPRHSPFTYMEEIDNEPPSNDAAYIVPNVPKKEEPDELLPSGTKHLSFAKDVEESSNVRNHYPPPKPRPYNLSRRTTVIGIPNDLLKDFPEREKRKRNSADAHALTSPASAVARTKLHRTLSGKSGASATLSTLSDFPVREGRKVSKENVKEGVHYAALDMYMADQDVSNPPPLVSERPAENVYLCLRSEA